MNCVMCNSETTYMIQNTRAAICIQCANSVGIDEAKLMSEVDPYILISELKQKMRLLDEVIKNIKESIITLQSEVMEMKNARIHVKEGKLEDTRSDNSAINLLGMEGYTGDDPSVPVRRTDFSEDSGDSGVTERNSEMATGDGASWSLFE